MWKSQIQGLFKQIVWHYRWLLTVCESLLVKMNLIALTNWKWFYRKLQKLETDQKLFENQYNLLSVIVQNAMNGINFLRMQLEKQKQENLVVTLKNAELLTNFYEMEQINRRNEELISQVRFLWLLLIVLEFRIF